MKKLCWIFALLLLAAPALAVTPATPIHECGGYTYIVQADGSAQIVCWDGAEKAIEVPNALDGHVVTSLSECAFALCPGLESVALPDTVGEIGPRAFAGCASLGRVTLPEGLKRIGDRAFEGCEALLSIALPDSVAEVGENPFRGCANLYDIRVSPVHPYLETVEGVLFSRPDRRLVCFPMGNTARQYRVPEGVELIGAMAFDRDLYIEEIVLPDSLTAIGREAFNGCEALRTMNLPAGVQTIGEAAMKCRNLVLTIEDDATCLPQYVMGLDNADCA